MPGEIQAAITECNRLLNLKDERSFDCLDPLVDILTNMSMEFELQENKKKFKKIYHSAIEQISSQLQSSLRSAFLGVMPPNYQYFCDADNKEKCPQQVYQSIQSFIKLHTSIESYVRYSILKQKTKLKQIIAANLWADVAHACYEKENHACVIIISNVLMAEYDVSKALSMKQDIATQDKVIPSSFGMTNDPDNNKRVIRYFMLKDKFNLLMYLSKLASRGKKLFYVTATFPTTIPDLSIYLNLAITEKNSPNRDAVNQFIYTTLSACHYSLFESHCVYKSFKSLPIHDINQHQNIEPTDVKLIPAAVRILKFIEQCSPKNHQNRHARYRMKFNKHLINLVKTALPEIDPEVVAPENFKMPMLNFLNGFASCKNIEEKIDFIDNHTPTEFIYPSDAESIDKMLGYLLKLNASSTLVKTDSIEKSISSSSTQSSQSVKTNDSETSLINVSSTPSTPKLVKASNSVPPSPKLAASNSISPPPASSERNSSSTVIKRLSGNYTKHQPDKIKRASSQNNLLANDIVPWSVLESPKTSSRNNVAKVPSSGSRSLGKAAGKILSSGSKDKKTPSDLNLAAPMMSPPRKPEAAAVSREQQSRRQLNPTLRMGTIRDAKADALDMVQLGELKPLKVQIKKSKDDKQEKKPKSP